MDYWNNDFKGIFDIEKTSHPPLSHHSIIPLFPFGIHKTISTKNMTLAGYIISEIQYQTTFSV